MTSQVDATKPSEVGEPIKADLRANLAAIKQEIEHGGFLLEDGSSFITTNYDQPASDTTLDHVKAIHDRLGELIIGGGGAIAIEDEGSQVVAAASRINFVGTGIAATDAGSGEVTVTVAGGAAPVDSVFGRTGAVVAASGDYSIGQITGAGTLASLNTIGSAQISVDAVDNTKLANMPAATFKMRASGAGTGDPIDGTPAQARTALNVQDGAQPNPATASASEAAAGTSTELRSWSPDLIRQLAVAHGGGGEAAAPDPITVTATTHTLGHGRASTTDERAPGHFLQTDESTAACTFTVPADAVDGDSWEIQSHRPAGQIVKVISASLEFVTGEAIATGVTLTDGPGASVVVRITGGKVLVEGDTTQDAVLASNLDANNLIVREARLRSFREYTGGSSNISGAVVADYNDGPIFEHTLTGDVTSLTINNWPSNAVGTLAFILELAGFSWSDPTGIEYEDGAAPDIGTGKCIITYIRQTTGEITFCLGPINVGPIGSP